MLASATETRRLINVAGCRHYVCMQNTFYEVEDDQKPRMEGSEILAWFDSQEDAREAAARMIDNDFPPRKIALVGLGFYMLERVTARATYSRPAKHWGYIGVCFGVGYGVTAGGMYVPFLPPQFQFGGSMAACMMIFGGIGMLYGTISYYFKKKKPLIESHEEVLADRYRIEVPSHLVAEARRALEAKPE